MLLILEWMMKEWMNEWMIEWSLLSLYRTTKLRCRPKVLIRRQQDYILSCHGCSLASTCNPCVDSLLQTLTSHLSCFQWHRSWWRCNSSHTHAHTHTHTHTHTSFAPCKASIVHWHSVCGYNQIRVFIYNCCVDKHISSLVCSYNTVAELLMMKLRCVFLPVGGMGLVLG